MTTRDTFLSKQQTSLALYVHLPWCVKKCPYCDFNSHVNAANSSDSATLPESDYLVALIADFDQELVAFSERISIASIFFGGGTPSLLSAKFYRNLLQAITERCDVEVAAEITLEANPGAVDEASFFAYREAGINRLSIGVQSFSNQSLQRLGRIHDASAAYRAFAVAREAGFDNINIDLMHGLPDQSLEDALHDLQQAVALSPEHLSWYQLTIEPNTVFYKHQPVLPEEETLASIGDMGLGFLSTNRYVQYEVSAYAREGYASIHNLNYWTFGDYIGIGAGAHGKLTRNGETRRRWKRRIPSDYMQSKDKLAGEQVIALEEMPLEFMMNVLRLSEGFALELFSERTDLQEKVVLPKLVALSNDGLLQIANGQVQPTVLGKRYLNDMVARFID